MNTTPSEHRSHRPFGLRTVKTAVAVTLAVLFSEHFSTVSPLYAAMGAMVAMDRTFSDSLKSCLTQLVGVICGSLFGYLLTSAFPAPQAWMIGLGVLLIIVICNYLKMPFTVSLSCIVFLSLCVTPTDDILRDTLLRLRDTTIGLAIALVVNVTIQPYNNTRRILALFRQITALVPDLVRASVLEETYPDLHPLEQLLYALNKELLVFRRQRFFRRKHLKYDTAYFEGCRQLAVRIQQELAAICCMDTFGTVGVKNAQRLAELGIALPPDGLPKRKCTRHDTIVMNYHLEKLLDARKFLNELIADTDAH